MTISLDSIPFIPKRQSFGIRGYSDSMGDGISFLNVSGDTIYFVDLLTRLVNKYSIDAIPNIEYDIRSYAKYGNDSLFVITDSLLVGLNSQGEIFRFQKFENPHRNFYGTGYVLSDLNPIMISDMRNGQIFISSHSMDYSIWKSEFYKAPIECSYNITDSSFSYYCISFPRVYSEFSFGNAFEYNRVLNGNREMVYTFPAEPDLSILQIDQNVVSQVKGSSTFQQKPALSFDTLYRDDINQIVAHQLASPLYGQLLYDPYRRLYYRFFYKDCEIMDDHGKYLSIFDKPCYLMIFDEDFRLLNEVLINESCFARYPIVTKNGIYIQIRPDSTHDSKAFTYYMVYSLSFDK